MATDSRWPGVLISPKFTPVYGQLGTTFGGNHLACAAAIAVLDVMKEEKLVENAGKVGAHLLEELKGFKGIKEVRGRGLMIGMEFEEPIKELRQKLLFEEKVFTGVSGTNVIRLLPPLCLSMNEADEFLTRLHRLIKYKNVSRFYIYALDAYLHQGVFLLSSLNFSLHAVPLSQYFQESTPVLP